MTLNERIAKVVGLSKHDESYWHFVNGRNTYLCFVVDFQPEKYITHAKLCQQRMVDLSDKKTIHTVWIIQWGKNKFQAYFTTAYNEKWATVHDTSISVYADTEPAALVELFCRVFNITEE